MHPYEFAVLLLAGFCGGVVNAVAGGGSFVTLPTLLFFNVPPTIANATSAVAAWPGLMTAAYGYRRRLLTDPRTLTRYAATSLAGGMTGGALLILTPAAAFARAIPVLMLLATSLFLFAPCMPGSARSNNDVPDASHRRTALRRTLILVGASVMVGYFNAGSGIVVMAALSLCGMRETQLLNGFKNLLGAMAAGASITALAIGGQVAWTSGGLMMVGSLAGGLWGARVAQRIDAGLLRVLILSFSLLMTVYFFWKFW
ncbi:sulfite exporter TauE/SafE family protein [Burkholderia sp. Bp8998]|uniref:sulfite exporter TauE/SafE family protein n=1 Tax=Burkholderia sp. Bp8998 TaxID=2184557 RepID=UPI000F59ECFF|nr:sulfite exporter TauE/SafE family protein [Burkholderia sp. Bp8998]RQS21385.1 sulfite exporter TauE/SafE family protein [Burkholderia sp. Bp8998]